MGFQYSGMHRESSSNNQAVYVSLARQKSDHLPVASNGNLRKYSLKCFSLSFWLIPSKAGVSPCLYSLSRGPIDMPAA